MEGGGDVLPVVGERRGDVLLARDREPGVGGEQLEQGLEAVGGQYLGDVGALLGVIHQRGDLGELAVLLRELGGRGDLDLLRVLERALGEGREPSERLDLVPEHIHADRPLLGCREDVEQPAADRELTAILDLLDALVPGRDQVVGDLVEVEQLALAQDEAVRPERGVRHLLRQGHGADHDHGRGFLRQRVERRDAQANQVRWRRQMGLIGDSPARVVAHRPRREPGPEREREIAGGAVVAGDHDRGGPALLVEQRREHVRPQRLRHEHAPALLGEPRKVLGVLCLGEQRSQHLPSNIGRRANMFARREPERVPGGRHTCRTEHQTDSTTRSASSAARSITARTSSEGSRKRLST